MSMVTSVTLHPLQRLVELFIFIILLQKCVAIECLFFVDNKKRRFFPAVFLRLFFHFEGFGCKEIFKDFLPFPFFKVSRAYSELVWNDITHTAPTLTLPQRERGQGRALSLTRV